MAREPGCVEKAHVGQSLVVAVDDDRHARELRDLGPPDDEAVDVEAPPRQERCHAGQHTRLVHHERTDHVPICVCDEISTGGDHRIRCGGLEAAGADDRAQQRRAERRCPQARAERQPSGAEQHRGGGCSAGA